MYARAAPVVVVEMSRNVIVITSTAYLVDLSCIYACVHSPTSHGNLIQMQRQQHNAHHTHSYSVSIEVLTSPQTYGMIWLLYTMIQTT